MDVRDELFDRFGDMPRSVNGLINVALLRNKAVKSGIYEIRQLPDSMMIFVKQINSESVAGIVEKLGGRATLSVGEKPHISVKLKKGERIEKILNEVFDMKF